MNNSWKLMAIRVAPRSWFNERKRVTFVSFVTSVFTKRKGKRIYLIYLIYLKRIYWF